MLLTASILSCCNVELSTGIQTMSLGIAHAGTAILIKIEDASIQIPKPERLGKTGT
jgi:hypothetical protein